MKSKINLIIGIMAAINVVYSFFGNSSYSKIFGFELNIWTYRAIWAILAFILLSDYIKKRKINNTN